MPNITITLDPQPSDKQLNRIARQPDPLKPADPAPMLPGESAPLTQLLNPTCTLIVRFTNLGTITLLACVLDKATYKLYDLVTFKPSDSPISFEFVVEPGDPDLKVNPEYPNSGLLLERTSEWSSPWDDEIVHALGGQRYPFGTDPIQQDFLKGGMIKNSVLPQNTLRGVFTGPPTNGDSAQLVIIGIARTSSSILLPGTPTKTLSLWLPTTFDGSMKVARVDGSEQHAYHASDIRAQAAKGLLDNKLVTKPLQIEKQPAAKE